MSSGDNESTVLPVRPEYGVNTITTRSAEGAQRIPGRSRNRHPISTRAARGYAYLTAMFVLAVLTAGLALIGEVWETNARRDKEAELLHIGQEYRKAIERYYLAGGHIYPRKLEDLLKDSRMPGTLRYLRRLYSDPITGSKEWGIVKAADGGIMGVYSLSPEEPLKQGNFRARYAAFEGAQSYADWKFLYAPNMQVTPTGPGGTASPGSPGVPAAAGMQPSPSTALPQPVPGLAPQ